MELKEIKDQIKCITFISKMSTEFFFWVFIFTINLRVELSK